MTIEELAAASGMTVRNIRAHRGRGLLPPPEVRERVGYYGPEHLQRLALISDMQAQGFNLRAIERLLEHTRGRPELLMGLKQALGEPFEAERPQVLTLGELRARFGEHADEHALRAAIRQGVLVPLGGDRFEAPTPATLDAAEEVVARGVPLAHALAVEAKVRSAARAVAREFVRLFVEDVWKPFAAAGYPEQRWAEVTESIERLRPLSSKVLLAAYQQTMGREVDEAFGKELERLAGARR